MACMVAADAYVNGTDDGGENVSLNNGSGVFSVSPPEKRDPGCVIGIPLKPMPKTASDGGGGGSKRGVASRRGGDRAAGAGAAEEEMVRLTEEDEEQVGGTVATSAAIEATRAGSANMPLNNGQDTSPADLAECGECKRHPRPLRARSRLILHQHHRQQQQHQAESEGGGGGGGGDSGEDRESGEAARYRSSSAPSNPLLRLLLRLTRRKQEVEKKKDITLDMLQPSRYKPNDLQQMAEDTKFTKREVRNLYRAFKQECPNGIVDEETFKDVYEKIFPLGDASHYAHLVFLSIDRERTGGITFGDFMEFLSIICKGSEEDKLLWTFEFYDTNRDGVISRDEMLKVTDSIHELMGNPNGAASTDHHARVERVFDSMDADRDGLISLDEFLHYCNTREDVKRSLMVLP